MDLALYNHDSLCKGRIDDGVKERDENEDEGRVGQLHLVRLDQVSTDGAVHPENITKFTLRFSRYILFCK